MIDFSVGIDNNFLVRVKNLCVAFRGRKKVSGLTVIEEFTFGIFKNSFNAMIGSSGAGKSIFARTISALLPPGFYIERGVIEYAGVKRSYSDLEKLRGNEIFYTPQDAASALNPVIKIEKQLRECTEKNLDDCVTILKELNFSTTDAKRVLKSYPFQLSGGENQRCVLALALIRQPNLLILDEPLSAVDKKNSQKTMALLSDIQKSKKLTILLITHNKTLLPKVEYIHHFPEKSKILR